VIGIRDGVERWVSTHGRTSFEGARSRTHKARSQTRRAASLTLARKLSGSLS
jgi:hypothetical protein